MAWGKQVMNWSNRKPISLLLLLSIFVIQSCQIPSHEVSRICTLVGCLSSIKIHFVGGPISGAYTISISLPTGNRTLSCNNDKANVTPAVAPLASDECLEDGGIFYFESDLAPENVTITVSSSGGQVSRTLKPIYKTYQPNGEGCEPVCYSSSLDIDVSQK